MSQSSSRMGRWTITLLVLCALVAAVLPIPAARATGIRHIQPAATSTASIIRVSPTGSTTWPCGTSWANTCTLQTALTGAAVGDEIWVGAGVHKPTTDTDRTVTFQLRGNVAIYGGFAMTETLRSERNPATNVTVLSGDLGAVGSNGDNSYHVVTGSGVFNAIVDGFTVTGGNANGDSVYSNDSGGGLYNNHSNLTLTNVTFSDNVAANYGGGLYNNSGNSTLTNVTFSGNSASWGGGLFNASANGACNNTPAVTIINSTFSGNSASVGSGIYNSNGVLKIDSSTIVSNVGDGVMSYNDFATCTRVGSSIIAGNSGSDVSARDTTQRFFSLGYNIIGTAGSNVDFNVEFNQTHDMTDVVNPLVAPLAANGGSTWTMALLPASPAIDRGSASCPATDQRGVARPQGPACDSGAFEYEYHVRHASLTTIGAGNCTSWANACMLQTALTGTTVGDEVWVATGVYTPGLAITATFQLKSGVAIYGGFAMTETLRDQRNPAANVTVLSGDLDGNDLTNAHGVVTSTANITGTNAYHVVTANGVATTAVLDGFTVTGGNANSASPNNVGGGLYTSDGNPTLTNVTFSGNTVQVNGGGLYNGGGTPTLTNVTFSGNLAGWGGGGMFSGLSSPTLTNVTFSGNAATYGGGLYTYSGSNPTIRNTILWGNTAPNGAQAYNQNSTPIISDSVLQGGCPSSSTCSNIVTANPRLGALGNYGGGTQTVALLPGSSAINAGNDTVCPSTDQRGVARPQSTHCDIGAYEYEVGVHYASPIATGTGDCSSWANTCTLQTALTWAIPGDEIWVGTGVHKPTTGSDRTVSFQLKSGVSVYGGFAMTETLRDQRNIAANVTVLSGDIDSNDLTDPHGVVTSTINITGTNAYHVITGSGVTPTAVLDGFTVTGGNANDVSQPNDRGGGLYNASGSPALTNITFSGNSASSLGGGMYNEQSNPTLTNVTFSGNSATYGGNSAQGGGGMYNWNSSPTLTNVTFSGNSATYGGGMYNFGSSPTIRNTILWGNTASNGAQVYNYSSTPAISDSVVQGGCPADSTCANVITTDPRLGALGNYTCPGGQCQGGGATQTFPLLPGSSAIDATSANCPATDQRGVTRPQGSACDIGAFESRGFTLIKTGGDNQSTLINTAFSQPLMVSVTSIYAEPVDGGCITFAGPLPGASINPITITAIITDGAAAQWVTANNVTGTYSVIASANGASPHLTYNLTNIIIHHVYLPLVIKP